MNASPTLRRQSVLGLIAGLAAGAGLSAGQAGRALAADSGSSGMTADDVLSVDKAHRVALQIDPAWFRTLDTDRSERAPCDVTIGGTVFPNARIKEKGSIGSSQTLAGKPGFTITFGKAHPAGMTKLTLNNAVQDASLLHEHLAYELYRRAGVPAARTTHASVSVNGRGLGVYVLWDSPDGPGLARMFGAGKGKGNLYELIGYDPIYGAANHDFLELKDEDEGRTRDDIARWASAVGAPDDAFAEAVSRVFDLERFLTMMAVDNVIANVDGWRVNNNGLLYANPVTGLLTAAPKGVDQAFDLSYDLSAPWKPLVAQRILAIPALEARVRSEMNRVVEEAWSVPALLERMRRVADNLHRISASSSSGAVARDVAQFDAAYASMHHQIVERPARWRPR